MTAPVGQLWPYQRMMPTLDNWGPREKERTAIHPGLLPQEERAAGEAAVRRRPANAATAKRPPVEIRGDIEGWGTPRPVALQP